MPLSTLFWKIFHIEQDALFERNETILSQLFQYLKCPRPWTRHSRQVTLVVEVLGKLLLRIPCSQNFQDVVEVKWLSPGKDPFVLDGRQNSTCYMKSSGVLHINKVLYTPVSSCSSILALGATYVQES